MEEIKNRLFIFDLPQMISLVVTILIILTLSIIIFIKVKKVKKDKAPSGIVLIAEGYVGYIDGTFDEVTSHRLPSARFYIFTLATFLLVGNLTPMLGFEPIGTAFSVPLTLAISTWMGVFIAGLIHKKLKYIKEILIKPMDWIGKFSPLISLSARMYGNLIGGSTILVMIYGLAGFGLMQASNSSAFPFTYILGVILTPLLHFYFDVFGAILQTLVFTLLTAVYWSLESENEVSHKKISKQGLFKKFSKRKIESIY
ncbi:F0F1 ATP synthase subunit A [Mycoplasmopsis felis]|uniref:F0F1 ATP synthase subunit A n=1 Tax=Mycoplasmopsis felis TaxID=33923 RepID=UPI00055B6259|nr:F0F1 ATP synthase subunit A [Mycoplasmopsis felis]WQQ02057.1 F0F1 ATP synthase subunit A [Mycoplasmopsis felis]WQQ03543.1 F0F1 ATP synthase subunit A [Mycoplasmopsis felis]WQQ04425.1 F0F1 ATP synthase subunit A [Mycoplasmopsis felis]WQQ05814.1 F0F1 ATP synthase subunit A [Mycoplasmopsis felis]WQQ07469.1 F0F1 ATP synthase subunit A [Mycoplasmopsis felis]